MAFVVTVTFEIAPDDVTAFMPLMLDNAQASVREEPGCLQFDVCTDPARPGHVFLYEVYSDRAAFDLHLQSDHFARFDAVVARMIVSKRVATLDRVQG